MMFESQSVLAIDGGQATRCDPVPAWPFYAADQVRDVVSVLESGKVNQWTGHHVFDFEKEFSRTFDGLHTVAVANGSVALETALRALGVGSGDEVIVPARSFVATASSVSLAGGSPVFADVDYHTQLITADDIEPLIGPRTRAVIVVHLNGRPCDMSAIMTLADQRGISVIEDCAQSVGARSSGRLVGTFGAAAAFSFCQDKIITTGGEGGMVLLRDTARADKAWSWKDHGKSRDKTFSPHNTLGFRWLHDSFGTNGRMTEMQAAIGRRQLSKLNDWIAARNRNADVMKAVFASHDAIKFHPVRDGDLHAHYRLEATVVPERLRAGWDRDRIMKALNAEGIPTYVGACPEIYREGAFCTNPSWSELNLPNARRLGANSLSFLTHPTLDERYLRDFGYALSKVLNVAGRQADMIAH